MVLDIKAKGSVHVQCHRCLEEFEMPLDITKVIIVKTSGEDKEVDDDNIILADNAHDIHLAQHFYDVVSLAIPIKVTHPNNGCNEETLRTLEKYMVKNENTNDPRWDILKNVSNN